MRPLPMVGGMLDTVIRALGRCDLFESLRPEQLRQIAKRGELLQVAEAEVILDEGDPSGAFFLILSGHATVQRGPAILTELGPSDIVGEMGVLLGKARTASVVADSPSVLLKFDAVVFDALFERVPGFGFAISRALARRLEQATKQLGP